MKTKRQEEYEDTIRHAGRYFDHFELIGLLGITYQGICDVKERMEKNTGDGLAELLKKKLIDREYGDPFNLQSMIEYLNLPYKADSYRKALKLGRLKYEHITAMLNLIDKEFKIDE